MSLAEHRLARIVGLKSRPERNDEVVRLLKRSTGVAGEARWDTLSDMSLVEAALKPSNLVGLELSEVSELLYQQISTARLLARDENAASKSRAIALAAHDYELPLLFLALDKRLSSKLPPLPTPRLEALREAARALGLELTRHDTCIRRPEFPASRADTLPLPHVREGNEPVALRIPAMIGELPTLVQLGPRVDFLHALAEMLGKPTVCPFSLRGTKGGQKVVQPLLYVGVDTGDGGSAAPPNAIASYLCGVEVRGDVLLTSAEFREQDGRAGELDCREEVSVRVLVSHLLEHCADPACFVAAKQFGAMLSSWRVPTAAAFLPSKRPARALLNEFLQAHPQRDVTLQNKTTSFLELRDYPPHHPPPQAYTGHVWLAWPRDATVPPGATRCDDGVHIEMRTRPEPWKSKSKPGGVSAEDAAAVLMLDAISTRAGLEAAPAPFMPPLRVEEVRRQGGGGGAEAERPLLSNGTRVSCSYTLRLLPESFHPDEGAALPTHAASVLPDDDGDGQLETVWERREHDSVLLGANVLHPEVEGLLCEMGAGETLHATLLATLLGVQARWFYLELHVHAVEAPGEEKAAQLMFGVMGAVGSGVTHGEQRQAFVSERVAAWADCASLLDVGCGEAQLLVRLINERLPLSRLYGIDVDSSATGTNRRLHRASRKLANALASAASESAAAGDAPRPPSPSVTLLEGSLSELSMQDVDAIALVEVIEHLLPADLDTVGPVLLGRCAPRWLLVTTPNREYNLNWMEIPANQPQDANGRYITLPPVSTYGMRNPDHKFEWTRAEFQAWATGLAETFGYRVEFYGVGGGALDEVVPYGMWRGAGPQTQACVFERMNGAQPTDQEAADGSTPVDAAAALLRVVWDSQAKAL